MMLPNAFSQYMLLPSQLAQNWSVWSTYTLPGLADEEFGVDYQPGAANNVY